MALFRFFIFAPRFALAWRRRMRQPGLLWFFPGHHVSPQRIDVLGLEQVAPRRHAVLAFRHRIDEAAFLVGRKLTQVECALRVRHVRAVAAGTILRINIGALLDPLRRDLFRVLRRRARAEKREHAANRGNSFHFARRRAYSGISANAHTDPPRGTFLSCSPIRTTFTPPRPDCTTTYCLPLWVKVIGCALMPEPVSLPVNNRPPAVAMTAA